MKTMTDAVDTSPGVLVDCLGRAEILLPAAPPRGERCIATVVSPGFETYLERMLASLALHGNCQDALIVVLAVGKSAEIERVTARFDAQVIHCRPRVRVNSTVKSVLYSIAQAVDSEKFLCLDADMLVLGDLSPLFTTLDTCCDGSLLVCREGNGSSAKDVATALCWWYGGQESDLRRLLGDPQDEGEYPLVVNDGLVAGSRSALLALDGCIRGMPEAPAWVDERREIWWRNQLVFNLALARLRSGVELSPVYNLQLHVQDVEVRIENNCARAWWHGHEVRVLHFCGIGRRKHSLLRNHFTRVACPRKGTAAP